MILLANLVFSLIGITPQLDVAIKSGELAVKNRIAQEEDKRKRTEEAKEILESGQYLQSLEKYVLVFPDACWKCGSRHFSITSEEQVGGQITYWDGLNSWHEDAPVFNVNVVVCDRCGERKHHFDHPVRNIQGYSVGNKIEVGSPYLTDKEQNSIPDFPYPFSTSGSLLEQSEQ